MNFPVPDAADIWSAGDYPRIARRFQPLVRELVEALGLLAGYQLLDVAAGTGNVALAAAALDARVTATDVAPRMLRLGRARAAAAGSDITWQQADAAALPFDDRTFDVVTSCLGVIFAADSTKATSELARVLRPGGRLGLLTWCPDRGRDRVLADPLRRRVSPAPLGRADPNDWGRPEVVRSRLLGAFERVSIVRRSFFWTFRSPEEGADYFLTASPTHASVFDTLTETVRHTVREEVRAGLTDFADARGVSFPVPYLVITATRT